MADIAASVLAKLKNKAKASGISYQQCLQLFFQEEFLRRLAGSKYTENFVLKGGLFIYTLTNFESRATVDVDFLMRGLNNDLARMDEIIAEILAVDTGNDFVTFKAAKAEPIAIQRKYHGISTQITGYIKNVRVPFNVDIGVGDVIVPNAQRRNIQTQLDGYEKPEILTYSLESTIAEKFDAILQRLELTGRMKDFTISIIYQGLFILMASNCRLQFRKRFRTAAQPMIRIALIGFWLWQTMKICRPNGGTS